MIKAKNIFLASMCAFMFYGALAIDETAALDSFAFANELYQESKYDEALKVYTFLLDNEFESADLYFNLGNTHYKLENYALSIWCFEKALLLEPSLEEAKINLDLANLTLSDKVQELPRIAWWYYWQKIKSLFGVAGWTYISTFFLWVLAAGWFLFLTKRKYSLKRFGVYFIIVGFALFVFTASIAFNKSYQLKNPSAAIITTSNVYVKSAPEPESADLFVIHSGLKVKLEDKIGDWFKIKLADGKMGWVLDSELKKL